MNNKELKMFSDINENLIAKDNIIHNLVKENRELKLAAHRLLWEIINRDSDIYNSDSYHTLNQLLGEE